MRARGWKAGAIGAGDLGFGCARKTKLAGGAHGSAAGGEGRCAGGERRLADVRAQVAGGAGLRRGTRAAGVLTCVLAGPRAAEAGPGRRERARLREWAVRVCLGQAGERV